MKIVDLSCDVAGRFAAKLFAMADAEVIRPMPAGSTKPREPLGLYLDAHKKVVPWPGKERASELLRNADVVFTSFDQGRYLGFASESLPLPSDCVQVTTSSFGTWGPYATLRGGPLADWAAGGYLGITGEPEREPLIGPEHLCGYVAGYTAALAAEAGLRDRRRNGKGQHIDISTMESMLCVHQSTFSRLSAGIVRQRTGRYAEVYPLVVRPCRDGYVSLGVVTDGEFDRLAIAIGRPELAVDERFGKGGRMDNRDALDRELEPYLRERDAEDIVETLQANRVPATKVAQPSDIGANPQLRHRRFWDHPKGPDGPSMPGNPIPSAKVFAAQTSARRARRLTAQCRSSSLPLSEIVVLDFTAFWAGPSATRCLADLGADVIWIERPQSRADLPPESTDTAAIVNQLYFQKMNRNKRSLVLDLETSDGRDVAKRLAKEADVLVENFRPGVAEKLGIGPAEICAANPALVYVSLSGFGSSGPRGAWRSYGPNIEAASSVLALTGYRGGEPLRLGHALPDGVGGLVGALAALRGLREREERGRGGWFDISQLEAYTAIAGEEILAASMGQALPRIGNRSRHGVIQGVFPCRGEDQWIAIRLADPSDVERFAQATGLADLPQMAAAEQRDDDVVEALIGTFTALRDKHKLARLLQEAGLEALPVLMAPELVGDPHLRERGFFVEVSVNGKRAVLPGTPIHARRRLADPIGPLPRFGEHSTEVLAQLEAS